MTLSNEKPIDEYAEDIRKYLRGGLGEVSFCGAAIYVTLWALPSKGMRLDLRITRGTFVVLSAPELHPGPRFPNSVMFRKYVSLFKRAEDLVDHFKLSEEVVNEIRKTEI